MTNSVLDGARERLRPYVERARSFTGWTGHPQARRLGPERPWDYMVRARDLLKSSRAVLDMGTGGGERFGELLQGYSGLAVATEEWDVNAPIACRHLRSFGAHTVRGKSIMLPFRNGSFDLILNRHEELDPADLARVLASGGSVLTQQCWNLWKELAEFFPRRTDFGDHFHRYLTGFQAAGLEILDARTDQTPAAFARLEDLVFMLCVAPWEIPAFDPLGDDLEALIELENELTTSDGLVLTDGSYVIEARKP